jgi:plastocyanin
MRRRIVLALFGTTLVVLVVSVNATSGVSHQAPSGGKTVTVEMREFRFIPSRIMVDRGRVTFEVQNRGESPHVFQITGAEIDTHIGLLPGAATTLDVSLTTPGEYKLICPIPTHAEAGMHGSIVVR